MNYKHLIFNLSKKEDIFFVILAFHILSDANLTFKV